MRVENGLQEENFIPADEVGKMCIALISNVSDSSIFSVACDEFPI